MIVLLQINLSEIDSFQLLKGGYKYRFVNQKPISPGKIQIPNNNLIKPKHFPTFQLKKQLPCSSSSSVDFPLNEVIEEGNQDCNKIVQHY